MASFVQGKHRLWDQWLADFRFAINSAWHESTGFSPAEIAIGRKLKGPLERFLNQSPSPDHNVYRVIQRQQELGQQVRENVEKVQAKQAKYYNRRRSPACFQSGDRVWVRSHPLSRADVGFAAKLAERWKGPAQIVKVLSPVNYKIKYLNEPNQIDTVHAEHLKPYFGPDGSLSEGGGL